MVWPTWQNPQALDDLTSPWLHGDPVITHQQRKHNQGHKLTGVGLQNNRTHRHNAFNAPGGIRQYRKLEVPGVAELPFPLRNVILTYLGLLDLNKRHPYSLLSLSWARVDITLSSATRLGVVCFAEQLLEL